MRGVKKQFVLALAALLVACGFMLFSSPKSGGPGFALAVETPISITAANARAGTNAVVNDNVLAGATITAGNLLYIDTATNTLKLASAASAPQAVLAGIAISGAGSGQSVSYISSGPAVVPGGTLTVGALYCLGLTAGKLIVCTDEVSSNYVTVVGVAVSTTALMMKPIVSNVQVP